MTHNIASSLEVTPRTARSLVQRIIRAGEVPNLEGPPGIGKTAIHALVAQDMNLKLLDVSMTARMLEDFTGFMSFTEDGRAEMVPLANFIPMDGYDKVPEGYDGWLVFLDELPNASQDLKKAAYKLIHQGLMGDRPIHPAVKIAVAGNRSQDGAAAEDYDNGLKSRMVTVTAKANLDEWIEDVALPNVYDSRLVAFLGSRPTMFQDMSNSNQEQNIPCPRTWTKVANLIKGSPNKTAFDTLDMILFNGAVGAGAASALVAFSAVYSQLPSISALLSGAAAMPEQGDLQWAVMSIMLENMTEDIAVKYIPLVAMMDAPTRTLFLRMAVQRLPEIIEIPEYAPLLRANSQAARAAQI